MKINCPCQDDASYFEGDLLQQWDECKEKFNSLRKKCSALQLLIPDKLWDDLKDCDFDLDDASQQAISLIQYMHGSLKRTTMILHEFITEKDSVNEGYVKALPEKWTMSKPEGKTVREETYRHQKSRAYSGKLYELMFAWMLKKNGFEIEDLEAWNIDSADIIASKNGQRFFIECKCIGQEDSDFENMFLDDPPKAIRVNLQATANYLLFKTCEAAIQLENFQNREGSRVAVIFMLDKMRMDFALNGYLNFKNISFKDYADLKTYLIRKKPNKEPLYSDIFENPCKYTEKIDSFIFYNTEGFKFKFIKSYKPCPELEISNITE